MKIRIIVIALGFLMILCSCNEGSDSTVTNQSCSSSSSSISKNKILPLGASRVAGNRPDFESYRYELWKLLVDGGWDFDFLGTECDFSNYTDYRDSSFDRHHEGRGGWTSGQILSGIEGWLNAAGTPDIVLFSSPGGNDGLGGRPFDQAVENVNAIIDIIQSANPNVTILIEQMAPARSDQMTPELTAYFNQMQQEVLNIASTQTNTNSTVIAVDMSTGFSDALLADDVHYNEAGAGFIANRYYEALKELLIE